MDHPTDIELERLRKRLLAIGRRHWLALAPACGVPFSTLKKFAYGQVQDPAYTTVRAIERSLPEFEGKEDAA